MPSSTSSSETALARAPARPWIAVWIVGLVLAALAVGGAERTWRSLGHRPSVVDDPELWAFHRGRVADGDPRRVVLLGGSRIQLGFDPDTFQRRFPEHPLTQLAVDGQYPTATLHDLADDAGFRGTVVASMTAAAFLPDLDDERNQQAYVDAYHRGLGPARAVEGVLEAWLESRWVVRNPQVRLDVAAYRALSGQGPSPPLYLITAADRSRRADYSSIDIAAHRRFRLERRRSSAARPVPPVDAWLAGVAAVEKAVERLEARGSRVAFVRFPTAGEHWQLDEASYPRAGYWDRMAAATAAETIHFRDVPTLRGFDLPDTSHLDRRDTPAFTSALLDELVRRRVLTE